MFNATEVGCALGVYLSYATSPTAQFGYDVDANPVDLAGVTQAFNASGELCWSDPGGASGDCGTPPSGATSYTYDANGQRTDAGSDSFAYDATGAMVSASQGSSSYTYAADGLRTAKTTGGSTTVFSWDDTASVPQLIQDGNDYYIYGPDGLPVERLGASPKRWLGVDGFGSVIAAFDGGGQVVANQDFDTWGNVSSQTGESISLGWQGQYQDDETGLYYLRNRYYDPVTGQFTTPDPLEDLTGDRYGYAYNDPVNGTDPLGLWPDCAFGKNPNGSCRGSGAARDVAGRAADVGTALRNAPVTAVTVATNSWTGGDCDWSPHLTVVCYGGALSRASDHTFVTGSTINTTLSKRQFALKNHGHLLRHETVHTRQQAFFGLSFVPLYYANYGLSQWLTGDQCLNIFERQAGFADGGYTCCSG